MRPSRLFAAMAWALLCLPLTAGLLQADRSDQSQSEGRLLSPWPAIPRSVRDWRAWPKSMDAFLADHFGLRDLMIEMQSRIAYLWLRESNPDVLIGQGGRLFYYGDEAIAQSAGAILRTDSIRHTVDVVTDMREALSARGIGLVVASPPNAASIYGDDLPPWARNGGRATEPELVLGDLAARGLAVADLRHALDAARDRGNLYLRTDTHWTLLGAAIGYDAIVTAAGHPDWTVRPAEIMGPPIRFDSGDLARMLGAGTDLPETIRDWAIPSSPVERLGPSDAALQVSPGVQGGPAILILGDSFSEGTFATLAAGHAGRIGWLSNQGCGFDWSWIAAFRPDEVWWIPTERLMLCTIGTWPRGLPHTPRVGRREPPPGDAPR